MRCASLTGHLLACAVLGAVAVPAAPAAERGTLAPTPCAVEPRTEADVAALVALATPVAPHDGDAGLSDATAAPAGEPADEHTIAGIAETARDIAGCLNAEDWPR